MVSGGYLVPSSRVLVQYVSYPKCILFYTKRTLTPLAATHTPSPRNTLSQQTHTGVSDTDV